jgi:hypothetical protein
MQGLVLSLIQFTMWRIAISSNFPKAHLVCPLLLPPLLLPRRPARAPLPPGGPRLLDPWLAAAACAEEDRDPLRIPTRYNIMSALFWLIQGQQPGDSLVFHYSGKRLASSRCLPPRVPFSQKWPSEPETRSGCQGPNAYRHLALTADCPSFL